MFFLANSFFGIPYFFRLCIFQSHSSEQGRFLSSPKPSVIKSRFPRLSRDSRFEGLKFKTDFHSTSCQEILTDQWRHSINGSGDEASKNLARNFFQISKLCVFIQAYAEMSLILFLASFQNLGQHSCLHSYNMVLIKISLPQYLM